MHAQNTRASRASAQIALFSAVAIEASATIAHESNVLPPSETVIDASRTTRADMTDNVFASDVHACVARAEVLIKATGLSISSPLATTQSSAFFRTPGIRGRTPDSISGPRRTPAAELETG